MRVLDFFFYFPKSDAYALVAGRSERGMVMDVDGHGSRVRQLSKR
jgi:hypothetical protein